MASSFFLYNIAQDQVKNLVTAATQMIEKLFENKSSKWLSPLILQFFIDLCG